MLKSIIRRTIASLLCKACFSGRRQLRGARFQAADELRPLLGDDLDGIRRQQLVVAKRRGDGARPLAVFKPGLDVVIAVAAGLEAVDAHDLLFCQPGRQRDPGVGAFELAVVFRPARRKFEFALRPARKSATTGT